jgi:hypothetical protein
MVTNKDPYELPCKELVELLTDYLENRLSPFDQERFKRHLAICDPCVEYLEQFRLSIRAVGKLREEDIPPSTRQKLLEAFRDWKSSGGPVNTLKFLLLADLVNYHLDVFPASLIRALGEAVLRF